MTRKLLLMLLTVLCSSYAAFAQDPSVGGIVISPNPIQVGQAASLTASFGNGSSTDIPQSATATYTVNLPPNIGVTGSSVVVISPVAGTTANLSVTVGAYDGTNGTIVTVRSNNGPVPGNAIYDLRLAIVGVRVTGGLPPNVLSNALSSGIGTNNPNNDNASTPVAVTAGALPVALVSFTAKAQEDRTVALAWTTSLETNNKGFLIERSKDLKGFEKVGEVTELGANSNSLKNYHLIDQTPYAGTSYYRLTQMDLDGKSTVFPVVSVVLREGAYGVFPNPVLNDQQFRLSLDEPETAQINFYGADGRLMPVQKMGVESGNLLLKVTGKLSTGVYILTVDERGQTRKHRLIVE
ncbi:T9SS type A sorting domain-containing protein [Spirosoma sp. KCTC 42546]|uniref:T9SS type A sorting domain-containing protein n=1 Tax=Spirosoma sp. KCTC 42546 TaxID=2520506 RepID=UPI00115C3789|nr:T9SS type A sorting domain-containing protein [Spirosoma sp. KCTC 42546]QDK77677.1 T9SS type A sorting domain-containing protein [Spirosoma sp. KCTC 42546]